MSSDNIPFRESLDELFTVNKIKVLKIRELFSKFDLFFEKDVK